MQGDWFAEINRTQARRGEGEKNKKKGYIATMKWKKRRSRSKGGKKYMLLLLM